MKTQKEKITAESFQLPNGLAELTGSRAWVCYRLEAKPTREDPDHKTKPPINPHTGGYAKTDSADTWGTYEEALSFWRNHPDRVDGLGLIVKAIPGLYVVDLDECLINGKPTQEAQLLINLIHSYTETSPSGNGLHIIARSKWPEEGYTYRTTPARPPELAAKSWKKIELPVYVTVTGQIMGRGPQKLRIVPSLWAAFLSRYFQEENTERKTATQPQPPLPVSAPPSALSNDSIIRMCMRASNSSEFELLYYQGDDRGDHSAADLALIQIMAFYTKDPAQLDSLFRSSALMRDKWDQKHRADGATYGEITIEKALATASGTYTGNTGGTIDPGPTWRAAGLSPVFAQDPGSWQPNRAERAADPAADQTDEQADTTGADRPGDNSGGLSHLEATAEQIRAYIREAREQAEQNRKLYEEGQKMGSQNAEDFRKKAQAAENAAREWERQLRELAPYIEAYPGNNTAADYLRGAFQEDQKTARGWKDTMSGFPAWDSQQSFYPGLYVVGAIPSLGKSTLMLQLAYNLAEAGTDVIYFSLEQSKKELASKLLMLNYVKRKGLKWALADNKGLNAMQIQRGEDPEPARNASDFLTRCGNRLMLITSIMGISADFIREEVELYMKDNPGKKPAVFVDYLQILEPVRDPETKRLITDRTLSTNLSVKQLKLLQAENQLMLFLVSAYNRSGYRAEASMDNFRESSSIEYTADVLLGLGLEGAADDGSNQKELLSQTPRKIFMENLKNRHGARGYTVKFDYYPALDFFRCTDSQTGKQKAEAEALKKLPLERRTVREKFSFLLSVLFFNDYEDGEKIPAGEFLGSLNAILDGPAVTLPALKRIVRSDAGLDPATKKRVFAWEKSAEYDGLVCLSLTKPMQDQVTEKRKAARLAKETADDYRERAAEAWEAVGDEQAAALAALFSKNED